MDNVVKSLRHAVLQQMVHDPQFRQAFKAGQLQGQLDRYSVKQVAFAVSFIDAYQKHVTRYEKTLDKIKEFEKLNVTYQPIVSPSTGKLIPKETFMEYMRTGLYEDALRDEDLALANHEIITQSCAMMAKDPDYRHWYDYFLHADIKLH